MNFIKIVNNIYHNWVNEPAKDKKPEKCKSCGRILNDYTTYANGYKGYCCDCEDLARYTGNLHNL